MISILLVLLTLNMLTGLQDSLTFGKTSCPFVETSFTTRRSTRLEALSHTVAVSLVTYMHAYCVLVDFAIRAATRYHKKDNYKRNRRDLKIYDKQYMLYIYIHTYVCACVYVYMYTAVVG